MLTPNSCLGQLTKKVCHLTGNPQAPLSDIAWRIRNCISRISQLVSVMGTEEM
jgi:hypothetical protein